MPLTWQAVLERDDLVGGDIESIEGGSVYRGPLKKIWEEEGEIFFSFEWLAKNVRGVSGWVKYDPPFPFFCVRMIYAHPQDIGEGRVHFEVPMLGACTIFPKGGSKLDSSSVQGFKV